MMTSEVVAIRQRTRYLTIKANRLALEIHGRRLERLSLAQAVAIWEAVKRGEEGAE
jgi:hypothetical protein